MVTAHLSGCILQRWIRRAILVTDTHSYPTVITFPNIQYSDLVARFLELDIAPRKYLSAAHFGDSNLPYQHSMSQHNLVYTMFSHLAIFFSYFFIVISTKNQALFCTIIEHIQQVYTLYHCFPHTLLCIIVFSLYITLFFLCILLCIFFDFALCFFFLISFILCFYLLYSVLNQSKKCSQVISHPKSIFFIILFLSFYKRI